MCFSPAASFGSSSILVVVGVVSLVSSRSTAQRVLSGIPLIFALQQFVEGILWLALLHPEWAQWQRTATYGFLIFAQVVWPVYVPFAMLLFEHEARRKKVITWLTIGGSVFSAYIAFCLFHYSVLAVAEEHHIRYDLGFSLAHQWYYGLLYFLPTIVAPVISSVKKLHWLGYLFLSSYVVARLLFHFFVISVWCFFGAIISIIVLWMVLSSRRAKDPLARL